MLAGLSQVEKPLVAGHGSHCCEVTTQKRDCTATVRGSKDLQVTAALSAEHELLRTDPGSDRAGWQVRTVRFLQCISRAAGHQRLFIAPDGEARLVQVCTRHQQP